VSARNLARVASRVARYVVEETDFILDLGGLDSIDIECRSLIQVVDDACRIAGVAWVLVAADDIVDALDLDDDEVRCWGARTVPAALRVFADAANARQRVVLSMLGRTA
jgi:hypothetical protein